ncbi:MAG: substrate-binding domain-containing protein [Opitutaceae bacterium]|nr:substrate-binding domain-containing protein [Opitutaceae bacterium]
MRVADATGQVCLGLGLLALGLVAVHGQGAAPDALPAYEPSTANVHGVVRIHDSELTQHLVHLWQDRFLKLHPLVRYKEYTVPAWFNGLCAGTADLAFAGRRAYRSELKAFESIYGYPVTELVFATGGFNQRKGNTPGVIIFVHKDNPLRGLTLDQLDGILGAERTGGWERTQWTTAAARGPEKNIRTWGQLGLTGEWANQPITIFGIDATLSGWSGLIQQVVFKGGDKWNPVIHEIVRGGTEVPADAQIVNGVAQDRYAIGFSFMRVVEQNPGVKPLALAAKPGEAFVTPTADSFHARTYPLVTSVYIYLNRPPGQPLPPRLREFLTFILSREGQAAVAEDGMYIPLNAEALQAERKKLE